MYRIRSTKEVVDPEADRADRATGLTGEWKNLSNSLAIDIFYKSDTKHCNYRLMLHQSHCSIEILRLQYCLTGEGRKLTQPSIL